MAKIKLNRIFQDMRGKLDGHVFRRSHTGELSIVKLADMSNVKWSAAQQAHRQRFKKAIQHAKEAMADPDIKAHYEKAAQELHKRPFDLAVSDYFKDQNLLET